MSLQRHWYANTFLSLALLPLSWLFCAVAAARRWAYRSGLLASYRAPVPVIVVGNLSVGGSGKTPLVAWIVELLRREGWRPGIVSRGYGGSASSWPQQVRPDSDPRTVGDEPVLLAQACACPVAVGPDRAAAVRALLEHTDCDVVVADDGLQHYALERDIEVVVVDGTRRFGNGRCLPAGPLRERPSRLQEVDFVVSNGTPGRLEYPMRLEVTHALNLKHGDRIRDLGEFVGTPVHAVAGIGHPQRFFSQLRAAGLQVIEHAFADHHDFGPEDLEFPEAGPILMTEKDAVKCRRFASSRHWVVPARAEVDGRFGSRLLALLRERAASIAPEGAVRGGT